MLTAVRYIVLDVWIFPTQQPFDSYMKYIGVRIRANEARFLCFVAVFVPFQVKPPKDRLIKDFTLNWRPNSDIVYVYETEPSGVFAPILGMYEKQTVTHNKKFLYRQVLYVVYFSVAFARVAL